MVELSVLMPCYNESKKIKNNILETIHTVENTIGKSFELIVIDDGSSDETFREIEDCSRDYSYVKPVKINNNSGKGNAIKKGFKFAKGDYICFLDGDLDIHPRAIQNFINLLKNNNSDVVIGSKHHPLSNITFPMRRTILSKGYQIFLKVLFNLPVSDTQVGLKLFKRNVLEDILPRILCKKYAFDIEILVNIHRMNYEIIEAPVDLDLDTKGSNVDIKAFSLMFVDTCAIYYRASILGYYDAHDAHIEKIYQRFVNVMKYPYSLFIKIK